MEKELLFTNERNILILLSLLKQSGIRHIIASPGSTNITFVGSAMLDSWFIIHSCVDERSAAYMAVGIAAECNEPVVLSCTGATASRNYFPALTEAYYRKLPIIAVTSSQEFSRRGHMYAQMLDRTSLPADVCMASIHVPVIKNNVEGWAAECDINKALHAMVRHGGGPVHINLATGYSCTYDTEHLPDARLIGYQNSETPSDKLPQIPVGRIGIRVGNHKRWSNGLTKAVESFCEAYGAVVFCAPCSAYPGKYRIDSSLLSEQLYGKELFQTSLIIHIGEVEAYSNNSTAATKEVWRVNEDGEIRDPMGRLTQVFEMSEEHFFSQYVQLAKELPRFKQVEDGTTWIKALENHQKELLNSIPELPFSNAWMASVAVKRFPADAYLHLAILSSQRNWGHFLSENPIKSNTFVNTGGFGIDGCLSSTIGGAIANPQHLHFIVMGDLAFFYDMNSLGNRHIGHNLRILINNNGAGMEMLLARARWARCGHDANMYFAAGGHFGNQNRDLIKHYVETLGFKYLSASSKEEFLKHMDEFMCPEIGSSSIVMEVFTQPHDEDRAEDILKNLTPMPRSMSLRQSIKSMMPEVALDTVRCIRKVLKK